MTSKRNEGGGGATGGGTRTGKSQTPPKMGAYIMKSVSMFLTSGRRASGSQRQLKLLQGKGDSLSKKSGRRRIRRPKMEDPTGKPTPKLVEMLKKKTQFTKDEIESLCRIYKKLLANCSVASKSLAVNAPNSVISNPHASVEGIDRIVFRELLHSTFDIITEETVMERMFCCWDMAHEGLPLRLEGWLVGLSIFLRGTAEQKAAFCFRVYDLNADGFITKDEMFTLLRNCLIKQPQDEDPDEGVKDLVEIILKKFDIDKDGKVSFEDFSETVKKEPLLLEAFGQCLPSECATVAFFSTLQG